MFFSLFVLIFILSFFFLRKRERERTQSLVCREVGRESGRSGEGEIIIKIYFTEKRKESLAGLDGTVSSGRQRGRSLKVQG